LSFAAVPSTALAEGEDESAGETLRIRSTCRACGKCECGVWVTVQDNVVLKVEGDESNSHSRGHCCAKSQSSMLALYHPDRLRYTMKRTNPKGEDDPGWVRVSLADAMDDVGAKFSEIVEKYGGESCFAMGGTSRVWAQPPYGTLKTVFPTPNAHLAYEICKGPRHFGGILTDEIGSPWMEVEQGPLVYVQWGTAPEYSNYDSTNRTVVDCSQRAYKHILVDPRMTPMGKEADIWLPLRVGTDMCMALGWIKWTIDNEAYDDAFVRRWTNAPFLYNPEEDGRSYKGWFLEMNGGIDMTSRLLTEADLDRDWVSQYW
ncbi:MAG: molybdopterin-dependent oxidoreductase, partial [Eggerthellaceae bacterium]|nr:molybdopterin-dependent oxidoreductase [Eggerthellaceae bacterium]